jgi:hypothetical protein
MEFDNNTSMTWEGVSCNGRPIEGSGVGVIFNAENGSLRIDGGNAYSVYDLKGTLVKEVKSDAVIDSRNLSNPSADLDSVHILNFLDGIRDGAALNADILSGHKSTLLVQLGNIAQRSGKTLNLDPSNGHIINDSASEVFWSRDYQPGWKPEL